jgi:NDP-sugar pyrophosphorylase family protein
METKYEAIILCADTDIQLSSGKSTSKATLKVGKLSLLEYQIRWLMKGGIRHIILATDKEYTINDALIPYVTWSLEEHRKGTGGATMIAVDYLKNDKLPFYLMNLDDVTFYNPIDLIIPETQARILVSKPKIKYGKAELRQEIVLGFKEKPYIDFYVSCGHYTFKKHIVETYFPDYGNLEDEVLPKLADERILNNFRIQRWITINSDKEYQELLDLVE